MELLNEIDSLARGISAIIPLVGIGFYLTIRLAFIQARHLGHANACVCGKYDDPDEGRGVSHF